MKAVVVANGTTLPEDARELDGAALVVAADGAARTVESWGRLPDAIVGDMDSLGEDGARAFEGHGVELRRAPADKDETDLELAVALARERGATEIVVLGAFGGARLDYDVANAPLLAAWGPTVRAVRGPWVLRGVRGDGELAIEAALGARVTLVALAEGTIVTTDGLRFPLRGEPLRPGTGRGVSNVVVGAGARVRCAAGALLVAEERG